MPIGEIAVEVLGGVVPQVVWYAGGSSLSLGSHWTSGDN